MRSAVAAGVARAAMSQEAREEALVGEQVGAVVDKPPAVAARVDLAATVAEEHLERVAAATAETPAEEAGNSASDFVATSPSTEVS